MRKTCLAALGTLTALAASPATSAILQARPDTILKVLDQAKGGDTVRLAPGAYAGIRIAKRKFSPQLVIDATGSTVTGFEAAAVSGLTVRGGTFLLPPPRQHKVTGRMVFGGALRLDNVEDITIDQVAANGPGSLEDGPDAKFGDGYGVLVVDGRQVKVTKGSFQGLKVGVVLNRVDGFGIHDNTFVAMRSDGVDAGEARNGQITGNTCTGTRPLPEDHPDCIQLWSRPTSPPTADIVIRNNKSDGKMQGVSGFNHVRDGVDDGGFDRITIEDNDLRVGYPHGVALTDGRASVVRNNRVRTVDGARWRGSINLTGEVLRCGNVVEAGAGKPAIKDPACER